jgi:phosphate starvation-inducible PhoH-like protein
MAKSTRKTPTPTPSLNEERQVRTKKEIICSIIKKKTKEKFLTQTQKNYYDVLTSSEVTVCSGPAGVGKSYITMKAAIDLLADPSTPYEKIIIVRPAVEAEEKLGSLPGNVEEKLDPYILRRSKCNTKSNETSIDKNWF